MKKKFCFGFLLLIMISSFFSDALADAEKMNSAYVTNGEENVFFSYPRGYTMINDDLCGTLVYIDDYNYVAVTMAREHQSGIETLHENMNNAKNCIALTDNMHLVAVRASDNHWMPRMDVVNIGINLPDGKGIVISAFAEEGRTDVYSLLLSIVASITEPAPLTQWINEQWVAGEEHQRVSMENDEKNRSNSAYSTLADRDGNIAIIGNGTVYTYQYATMELLWQVDFEGYEHSVSRNTNQDALAFVTKDGEKYIAHHVNMHERQLESFPISEQGFIRFYFVNDGIIYRNEKNEVKKVSYSTKETNTLMILEPGMDIYDAESSEKIDYIVHTDMGPEGRRICVSGFTKQKEHRFTTDLYDENQAEPALCESIVIDGKFVVVFHPRNSEEAYKPILWVSAEGEIICSEKIDGRDCCINLRSDGKTDNLYAFININRDPTIIMQVYNPQGQMLNRQVTEQSYPFSTYYNLQNGWYIWNEDKTELIAAFE